MRSKLRSDVALTLIGVTAVAAILLCAMIVLGVPVAAGVAVMLALGL